LNILKHEMHEKKILKNYSLNLLYVVYEFNSTFTAKWKCQPILSLEF
jgi:hypothetical protein